jgi:alanine dehydrogenase
MNATTLVLSRSEVMGLLSLPDCIEAVEDAFRLHADGRTLGPGVLGVPAEGGGFHIKAAGLMGERSYFAAKTNANFPDNPRRAGLPTIQGTLVLADARDGRALALMDSGSVTALRTGAATAVAGRYLARPDSRPRPSSGAACRERCSSPRSPRWFRSSGPGCSTSMSIARLRSRRARSAHWSFGWK